MELGPLMTTSVGSFPRPGALRHLDPNRLLLAPDCGLMTIPRALARAKVEVMVAAARALRRELGPGGAR